MLHEEYLILINEEKIMFKTTLKITAFSLLSVLATASAQASQINNEGLRLVPTNTVLEGAPLYTTQVNEDKTVTTYFNTSKTSGTGNFQLLPTYSVQEGSALYSYQEIQAEETIVNAITLPVHSVDKSKLQLLPTYSVLEGDALYSYQEVIADVESVQTASATRSSPKNVLVQTNTVLEGAPLYAIQDTSDEKENTQFYATTSAVEGELYLLPTNTVLEGEALYSYQAIMAEQANPKALANDANVVAKGELRLLPTNSVLEGEALYSYQEIKTKDQSAQVYAEVTKSNNKSQEVKKSC
jgi:hypothetical protein